jgi:hypothetical protein
VAKADQRLSRGHLFIYLFIISVVADQRTIVMYLYSSSLCKRTAIPARGSHFLSIFYLFGDFLE